MRVSVELGARAYKVIETRRDNAKGVLPEYRFASFMYTTDEIQKAINGETPLVGGKYFTNDYEILTTLKSIFTPAKIKFKDVDYVNSVKSEELSTDHTEYSTSDRIYSIENRPYQDLFEEYELKQAAYQAAGKAGQLVKPVGKKAELLSPTDYKLVQETLMRQAGKQTKVEFTNVSELRSYSAMNVTIDSIWDRASFDGKMFNCDNTNGIRPIALDKSMFPFVDFTFAIYNADDMFIRWFDKQVFGK